jgi:hypothetical protein
LVSRLQRGRDIDAWGKKNGQRRERIADRHCKVTASGSGPLMTCSAIAKNPLGKRPPFKAFRISIVHA